MKKILLVILTVIPFLRFRAKKTLAALAVAALMAASTFGQGPPITKQTAQQYDTPPFVQAPAVSNFSAAPAAAGSATCYYWIVTQTQNATSIPLSLPLFICPTTAGGTAQNPVSLNWNLVPGATYDVLETTTSTMPTGTNTVAIAIGLSVGNLTDTGQARSSYTLLPAGLSWNEFNNLINGVPTLQWCYNGTCILSVSPNGVNITPTAPPGGGTGTAGGVGGGCTATLVLPGMVCAGPIPTPSGVNPTLEQGLANNGGANTASPATIAGAPLTTSPSIALIATEVGNGSLTNAPDGTWTLFDDAHTLNNFTIYRKNLSSTTPLSLSSSFTQASNTSWQEYLIFLGGTFGSIPHTATSGTVTCAASDNCAQATIASVTANNALLLFGSSPNGLGLPNATVQDSLGDSWQKVASTNISSAVFPTAPGSTTVWIDQFASTGTHVINIDGHQAGTIIGGCCKIYEVNGTASYYAGAAGPSSFRYLTTQDLASAGITNGILQSTRTTLGSDAAVTANTTTTILTKAITMPASGCPCRVDAKYGLYYTFPAGTLLINAWVSESGGANPMASSGFDSLGNGSGFGLTASETSPVQYTNGATVTFILVARGNAAFTVQAAPQNTGATNTYLDLNVIPSN